jgi:isoquinoline 1-oxidoreductase subunit alpha
MDTKISINGSMKTVQADTDTPLLWVLRDDLKMTGTKFGCGMALCGACTIHIDGAPTRSCITPLSAVGDKAVTTIDGISGPIVDAVKKAWIEVDVVQCGYCQPGQIMAAAALLTSNRKPTDQQIDEAMSGNLCRCGTYQRVRLAIHAASKSIEITSLFQSPSKTQPSHHQ